MVELQNSEGKTIRVRFREFEPRDAESIVNCIRQEYGDSYRKQNMYDPNYIVRQFENRRLFFYLAELESGEIIGCLALTRNPPNEIAWGIATGITLKPYRNYGVFWNLTNFITSRIRQSQNIPAVYCHSQLYHSITQKIMERVGLKPVGFMLSMILARDFTNSYSQNQNTKLSLGILTRKISKHDVGILYLPPDLEKFARGIYGKLHTHFKIETVIEKLSGASEIEYSNDPRQQNCTIKIHSAGSDLKSRIESIQSEFREKYQTFNVFLNISDSKSPAAIEILNRLGYFCSGFNPLCSEKEIMILQNPRDVSIDFDELKLTPQFDEIRQTVKRFYESRNNM